MAVYNRIFTLDRVANLHRLFQEVILDCRAQGLSALAREYEVLYGQWQRNLNDIAKATSADATAKIIFRLKATAVRPDTGIRPHIRNQIISRPVHTLGLPTGQVGIADVANLDKARDPFGRYGPYWRTQEFGTGQSAGPGYREPFTRPDPSRFRTDTRFIVGRDPGGLGTGGVGPRGGRGGKMLIGREIQGRHFIRDGADAAYANWVAAMNAAENNAIARIRALRTQPRTLAARARRGAFPTRRRPRRP